MWVRWMINWWRAILRELDRGGQIFFVHNRVQTIQTVAKGLQTLVPEAVVGIGHGQMGERELEKIMAEFTAGRIDVLWSTTIIESGLDIPNANTMIVNRANMFGLAQLYQLRGRRAWVLIVPTLTFFTIVGIS